MLDLFRLFVFMRLVFFIKCDMQPFIVNGTVSNIEEHPHSAFLNTLCKEYVGATPSGWLCGASIVNQRVLLTAGHCVAGCDVDSYMDISFGHTNREKGTVFGVSNYCIHAHYRRFGTKYDIGLVSLRDPLHFGANVKRVAIMTDPPQSETAIVASWGAMTKNPNDLSVFLKYITQYLWKSEACKKMLSDLPEGTICAGSRLRHAYVSRGDSGSALVVRGYIQIGIVSYKMPKVSKSLVVYTDTGYFYDWIKTNSRRLYCA